MVSVRFLTCIGAAALIGTSAYAADLPFPQPPMLAPAPVGGWYLRGDVGVGVQTSGFSLQPTANLPATFEVNEHDIQDTAIAGFGIGYEVNNWLRFDVTGEYRTQAAFKAITSFNQGTCVVNTVTGTCFDIFSGNTSAAVFMANVYFDLGTWWCITPYIGGGVGAAWDRVAGVMDIGPLPPGNIGFGFTQNDATTWNFAWNVQAGLTYNVSNSFKVDFSWRFMDMGAPQSAAIFCQNTNSCVQNFVVLKDMTAQDFRVGLRWMLQPDMVPVAPLMTRG